MDGRMAGVLERLERQSELEKSHRYDVPPEDRMLAITKDTGMFYNVLLRSSGVRRVLEIGTSTGYSTLWFADAVMANGGGEIVTIERNPSKVKRAMSNFEEAGTDGLTEVVQAAALDTLNEMRRAGRTFDFAFIDADKENCKEYFSMAFPMLKVHGIIGTDNMLYPSKYRKQMEEFADYVRGISNAETVTLVVGNGQELTVKTGP